MSLTFSFLILKLTFSEPSLAVEGKAFKEIPTGACSLFYEYGEGNTGICGGTLIGDRQIVTASHCGSDPKKHFVQCGGDVRTAARVLAVHEDSVILELDSPFETPSEILLPENLDTFRKSAAAEPRCFIFGRGGDEKPEASETLEGVSFKFPKVPVKTKEHRKNRKDPISKTRMVTLGEWNGLFSTNNPVYEYNSVRLTATAGTKLEQRFIPLPFKKAEVFGGDSGSGLLCLDKEGRLNLVGVISGRPSDMNLGVIQVLDDLIKQVAGKKPCR